MCARFLLLTILALVICNGESLLECNPGIYTCQPTYWCSTYSSHKSVTDNSRGSHFCNDTTGLCYCGNAEGYNDDTCMPDVNGCTMCGTFTNSGTFVDFEDDYPGYAAYYYPGYQMGNMNYCFNDMNDYDSYSNEIRVIGVYESPNSDSIINLNLTTCSNSQIKKPLILSLSSYDPIHWIITSNDQQVIDNLEINSIQAIAYNYQNVNISVSDQLTVTGAISISDGYSTPFATWGGFGEDSGGGWTANILYKMPEVFGDYAYSYIGAYVTNYFDICVGDQNITTHIYDGIVYEIPTTMEPTTTDSETTKITETQTTETQMAETETTETETTGSTQNEDKTCEIVDVLAYFFFELIEQSPGLKRQCNICLYDQGSRRAQKRCESIETIVDRVVDDYGECVISACNYGCAIVDLEMSENTECGCEGLKCNPLGAGVNTYGVLITFMVLIFTVFGWM